MNLLYGALVVVFDYILNFVLLCLQGFDIVCVHEQTGSQTAQSNVFKMVGHLNFLNK